MVGKIAEMTMAQERYEYEKKETQLNIETLMEEKQDLQELADKLQKEVAELMEYKQKYEESVSHKSQEAKKTKMSELARMNSDILQGKSPPK